MSIIDHAINEMRIAKVEPDAALAIVKVLRIFLEEFDSGGAVHVGAEMLTRLIAAKPLTPLTGEDSEWIEQSSDCYQNKRCSSVFKTKIDIPHTGFKAGDAYDIDNYIINEKPFTITFPYYPEEARVPSPIIEFSHDNPDGPTAA